MNDYPAHKDVCQHLGKVRTDNLERRRAARVEKPPSKKALFEWFQSLPAGVMMKTQCAAWEIRHEKPVVLMQTTSSSSEDPMAPRVTILPLREYLQTDFARTRPKCNVNPQALQRMHRRSPPDPTED